MFIMNQDNEDVQKIFKKMKKEEMQKILDKAKRDFEIKKTKKEKELASILPTVLNRVDKEQEMHLGKKKSKKKKSKKHNSSSSHSESDEQWVDSKIQTDSNSSTLTRDSWMTMDFLDNLPTVSKSKKEFKRPDPQEKLGCHERELNPYWKNGGLGLPAENERKSEEKPKALNIGDGGLRWWEKALERCKQMAVDEKKSLEEVASERYESLDFIYKKIAECGGSKSKSLLDFSKNSFKKFQKPSNEFSTSQKYSYTNDKNDLTVYDVSKIKKWTKKVEETSQFFNKNDFTMEAFTNKDTLEMVSSSSESEDEVASSTRASSNPQTADLLKHDESDPTLTEEQMNQLGAQIVKAEILGDYPKAEEIKKKLELARNAKSKTGLIPIVSKTSKSKIEILMTNDRYGNVRPVMGSVQDTRPDRKADRKRRANETHFKGERQKYFADDDKYSLEDLVKKERMHTPEDDFKKYARLANKMFGTEDDYDDRLLESVAGQKSNLMDSKKKQLAIIEQKRISSKLDKCKYCFDNIEKHLIIAIGKKSILCLPRYQSMVDGHCLIVPMQHITQMTQCDEDIDAEINKFIKVLSNMYASRGEDCVIMETSINLKKHEHCIIECVPMPVDLISSSPMYFKKAILEIGSEWAQNKKLVEVKGRSIRNAIPVGFPYFWVSFGLSHGYAHVIENEENFVSYFGREIVGGMLDLDPFLWRKPHIDSFENQRSKTLAFSKIFKNFDWTQKL